MSTPYRILAINGSLRSEKGFTRILLDTFLQGARSKDVVCEIVYPSKMKIHSCKACHKCIVKTPGVCFQKDDMEMIIEKIESSDLLVFGGPVYFDTMSSDMKRMFERLMPILGPVFEFRDGRTYHLTTSGKKYKVVSIMLCGNPERECLKSIGGTFRRIVNNMGGDILGEFNFPSSGMVVSRPELLTDQLEALTEAGEDIVQKNMISPELIARVNSEYIDDPAKDIEQKNKMFQRWKSQNGLS